MDAGYRGRRPLTPSPHKPHSVTDLAVLSLSSSHYQGRCHSSRQQMTSQGRWWDSNLSWLQAIFILTLS